MPAMQGLTKRGLPVCSNLSILSGANPHLTIQRAPGSKLQVNNGMLEISSTIKAKTKKQPQVGITEDECLSLLVGTTTSRRPITASTTGL